MPLSEAFKSLSTEDQAALLEEVRLLDQMQQMEVTSSEAWKSPRKVGFLLQLPSGNVCRIRRTLSMLEMIKNGSIPNPLRENVEAMIGRGDLALDTRSLPAEAKVQALDLIDQTVVAAVVDPRVLVPPEGVNPEVYQAPPGAISIMDLTIEDRLFICTVAQGGSADVSKFLAQQDQFVESVYNRPESSVPSKPIARTKRTGGGSKRK